MATTVSNLIGAMDTNAIPTGQLTTNTTSRIVQAVEAQVSLSLKENDELRVVASNLAIQGVNYNPPVANGTITGIQFAILSDSSNAFNNNSTEIFYDLDTLEVQQPSASISFSSHTVEDFKSKSSFFLFKISLHLI